MSNLTKEQQLIIIGLIASIVVGFGVIVTRNIFFSQSNLIAIEEPTNPSLEVMDQGLILIHVSGAVRREGVYRLKVGDRKIEAIQLAGGALITADLANLNLAEPIKDGERVVVPTKRVEGEKGSGYQNISLSGTAAGLVNINTAKAEELDKLQGIGLSTAKSIIEYRKKIGFFNRIEQLMELPRFGKAKFERIKNQITI